MLAVWPMNISFWHAELVLNVFGCQILIGQANYCRKVNKRLLMFLSALQGENPAVVSSNKLMYVYVRPGDNWYPCTPVYIVQR